MTTRYLVAGDTWGITGPDFLGIYLILAVFATVASAVLLRFCGGVLRHRYPGAALTPVQVGLLSGGDRLAVTVALAQLRQLGLVDHRCRTAGVEKPAADLDRVTRAVHTALVANGGRTRVTTRRLAERSAVAAALAELRSGLRDTGLLTAARSAGETVTSLLPLLAVITLGAVRLLVGLSHGKPVAFLVVLVALTVGLVVALVRSIPAQRRTIAATSTLRHLRADNAHLAPTMNPAWTTYGGPAVVLSAALFGGLTLTSADPAFAESFDARAAAPSGFAGSSSNSGGGGSSCGGGGSSCGGGGGCGGGGCGG